MKTQEQQQKPNNTIIIINIIIRNCGPFTNCISEINNTQIDKARDIEVVMPMYNLIEYKNDYWKTTGSS